MGGLLILSSLIVSSLLHIRNIAKFKYSEANESVQLEVTLEFSEIKHMKLDNSCDLDKTTAICLSKYILTHAEMKINDKEINFELSGSHMVNGHLVLMYNSTVVLDVIKSIEIKNTSFYEQFDGYKNRITLDLVRFQGSYLLAEGKSSIKL
jgi:hypothetical protein